MQPMQQLSALYIQRGQPNATELVPKRTAANLSVSTRTGDIAPTIPVTERMSAQQSVATVTTATQTTLSDNHLVNPIPPPPKHSRTTSHTVHTPPKVSTPAQELHSYPNKEFVKYLLNGFTFGFPIGYKGLPLLHRPTKSSQHI